MLGAWIVLRELAFYTHAIGTAAFPGLVVAGPWGLPPQLCALACGLGLAGGVERLMRTRRIDHAAATGLLLVLAPAAGIVLAALIALAGRPAGVGPDTAVGNVIGALFGLSGALAPSPDVPARLSELLFGDLAAGASVALCSVLLFLLGAARAARRERPSAGRLPIEAIGS